MDSLRQLCIVAIARNPRRVDFAILPDELYNLIYAAMRDPDLNERHVWVRYMQKNLNAPYNHMVELIYVDNPDSDLLYREEEKCGRPASIGDPCQDYYRTQNCHTINSISRNLTIYPSSHAYWLSFMNTHNIPYGYYIEERKLTSLLIQQGLHYDLLGPLIRVPLKYFQ